MKFTEQIAAESMRPTRAGLVVTHETVSQRADAKQRRRGGRDFSVGRIKAVEIHAQVQAILRARLVIELREQHQIVAEPRVSPQIGMNRVQSIRDLLQINRIGWVSLTVRTRYQQ